MAAHGEFARGWRLTMRPCRGGGGTPKLTPAAMRSHANGSCALIPALALMNRHAGVACDLIPAAQALCVTSSMRRRHCV
ncbi:hypothetical protein AMIS_39330 [Actinoplanes missouriensis 431]|uniref:Uncharacterized protein n=1 Tax=Actinoplanes missouriensis (strain ATCC 14538 / DSM 43046 / CBS 188.64 / JCM 3121 / NBRC 102363 / NCIMB 12654 / NRRL B-3342 / UNCC 431) TaxID=512565 RepID=I0H816_ACTM4|nr:hypothetical protein AMIS_39330 [Actinoplanes missouriensis 431]